jgi:hypothetical protein
MHHYVLTFSSTSTITFWIDGALKFTGTGTLSYGSSRSSNWLMADDASISRTTFLGALSDLRYYRTALDITAIQTLFGGRIDFVYFSGYQYAQCTGSCNSFQTLHCTTSGVGVCCGGGQFFVEGSSNACQNCSAGTNSDGSGST